MKPKFISSNFRLYEGGVMKIRKCIKIIPFFVLMGIFLVPSASAQGTFEFGFHYGRWGIDVLRGLIEEGLNDGMESTFRDDFFADIQQDYPLLTDVGYTQEVSFDSSGSNFGFEVRWYPGGRHSSFSFGLSVEKTSMTVSIPTVSAQLELSDGSFFEADASAEFKMDPLAFLLSVRWDIVPSSPFHPYITFGLGAATGTALENGEFSFEWSGQLFIQGQTEIYLDSDTKTLKEWKDELEAEEEDLFIPGFIPFIQLNVGLKGEVTENIHLLVDAGIWNGFLLRGGVAFRF
jgi:hypothetical protein